MPPLDMSMSGTTLAGPISQSEVELDAKVGKDDSTSLRKMSVPEKIHLPASTLLPETSMLELDRLEEALVCKLEIKSGGEVSGSAEGSE